MNADNAEPLPTEFPGFKRTKEGVSCYALSRDVLLRTIDEAESKP